MPKIKLIISGLVLFLIVLISNVLKANNPNASQQNQYGKFYIQLQPNWSFVSGSSGTVFEFRNSQSNETIKINKEPVLCESKQAFNKQILAVIQGFYKQNRFMEQRKQAAPYPCLGQKFCHMLVIKSRDSGERIFRLNPLVDNKMYSIEISAKQNQKTPSQSALHFISQITLEPQNGAIAQTSQPQQNKTETALIQSNQTRQQSTAKNQSSEVPASFKKNQSVAPQKPVAQKSTEAQQEIAQNKPVTKTSPAKQTIKPTTINITAPTIKIEKGNIPDVKFSASDPCAPTGTEEASLPWGQKQSDVKITLPKNVDSAIPPIIPELKNLSSVSYNSAVSAAFEGMRLVYGPMPNDEAKKFEAAWSPLFDYPTQNIIDYLNKLNPLVSQFLASREAYTRSLSDIQMVLLDAGTAIEMDDQKAWETAMAEAGMYASALQPLDAAMKSLALQIEKLGNPPNPADAKCEANRRYKRMFQTTIPEGCWAGFEDNLAISSDELGIVYEPKFEYIFKVNVNGTEKYFSIEVCIDCNLGMTNQRGNCVAGDYGDTFVRNNLMNTETFQGTWIDGPREGQMSQYIQKFEYPNIPEFAETSNEKLLGIIKKDKEIHKNWATWEPFIQKMIQSKTVAHTFYKTAVEWTKENRWQEFNYPDESWMCPDEVLVAFWNAMGGEAVADKKEKTPIANKKLPAAAPQNNKQKETDQAEQDRKDAIAFHTEMIGVIQHNLERDIAERNDVRKALMKSKDQKEAEEHLRRLKDLDLRIIGLQSNIQAEQDLVNSHKTGQLIHTRSVFDEYARNKFIQDTREQAARIDATRRIAERIDRQIELLPWEEQAKAREEARQLIDGKTIASGDLEKAKRLVNAFNKKIQGYAEYDGAKAKEAEVDAQQNEFYAQTTIMAAGALFVGFGSAALTQAYGAEAAITVYGPQVLGSIWGGTTGFIAGGPKEGLVQAVSWASPKGFAAMQFLEGYEHAGYQKDASTADKIWGGVKQAGTAYFIGKVFEAGVGVITKGSLIAFGEKSRLFKPIISSPAQRSTQVVDAMRTTQKLSEAKDAMKAFQNLEVELAMLKRNPGTNAQKISQLEAELQQLSASLNADYYAKWLFKYKASPGLRRQFDVRVQKNYSEMTPGMIRRLEQKGYNMDGIEFHQFRNATSGGSSSMDLDLGPVMKGTVNEPGIKMFKSKMVVKKDGSVVTMEQFMNDSQAAMNAEYKQLTGLSAPSSDMNLVTSAHPEAFSTPKLLDHNVDFSKLSAEEIASVGKVLEVKMQGIDKNKMLTNTAKMQAKCRESSKEIENMLLKKLRQDIQKAPAGSPQQKQIQSDINYWEDMLRRFKQVGTEETNPMKIIEMNREIMHETGGRDVTGVINDLKQAFNR